MLSPLRNRFGIPGVISVVALVFAMLGGAYAANNSSDGGATASAKAKKGPRGPKGATGPAGPAGPAGAKGDAGANGSNGAAGATGPTGATGTNGVSVNSQQFPGVIDGDKCAGVGGSKFVAGASTTYACNGAKGEPWTPGGTLPPGETLTGAWSTSATKVATVDFKTETVSNTAENQAAQADISFPIPLATAPQATFVGKASSAPGCPGVVAGVPTADPGNLCVYATLHPNSASAAAPIFIKTTALFSVGASTSGTVLQYTCLAVACASIGSWAVTAATE